MQFQALRHTQLIILWAAVAFAQPFREPVHQPLALTVPVRDKNFYLLSLIERTPAAARAFESDPGLSAIAQRKLGAVRNAATACPVELDCFPARFRVSEEESAKGAESLRRLYRSSDPVRRMVDGPLRESGAYIRLQDRGGEELLARAWLEAARGINNIIDVYGDGKAPRYPEIDSAAFPVAARPYRQLIYTAVGLLGEKAADLRLFFQPSLQFALYLLELNKRDEAGRHEPLETRDNQAAFRHLREIRWERFPYSAIVVPGSGPDRISWSLSPSGRLRTELAARRFKAGQAPLILVSGGYVHPNATPYAEAVEMKKSLMADYGIPEAAILIDPHARHTTTNLRNAARLMFRYNIPFERTALITTDSFQSASIESAAFVQRCNEELGYQPYRLIRRVSQFDLEFTPRMESLQIDPRDPLDP